MPLGVPPGMAGASRAGLAGVLASGRGSIVAALVPCALGYMYLNSPRDFRFLLEDPTGNTVLFYALGSVTLGLLITHLMVRKVT